MHRLWNEGVFSGVHATRYPLWQKENTALFLAAMITSTQAGAKVSRSRVFDTIENVCML